ncbi:BaiN/RdsA family NAD(P)/FAD-dependent oxidoreductase [Henriciella aquimarina]|uniref:NAD(P)/FAD-dependent oxidoreductase n=1 Tax=Henriciella aquimarina TaxID=545261 RepID=UPI000A04A44C
MLAERFETIVLGAGAAGLFCAARAGAHGQSVCVIDHAAKPAEKVRISGGGRCNFTNIHTTPANFLSENPHFAKSALARYTPWDFCDLVARHGLTWHEKTLGQLFCDQRSGAIIQMLLDELDAVNGTLRLSTSLSEVRHADGRFHVETSGGALIADNLVVATGGLSIPKMGASGLAYDLARQFGHDIVSTRPALVPFTFTGALKDTFSGLSGVACPVDAQAARGPDFHEAMLFTHRGLSGPAMLQVSSYWRETEALSIDLAPGWSVVDALNEAKANSPKQRLSTWLSGHYPDRLAAEIAGWPGVPGEKQLANLSRAETDQLAITLKKWRITPAGTEGWRTAEVTAGGISTDGLSSRSLESKTVPGLYFIGECVDVTGWLGGYNFQWAWASAAAAGEALASH